MSKDKHTIYFDRDNSCFVGLDDSIKKELSSAYKNIDIDAELSKMVLWLNSPKGLRRKGNIGFITNWLNNASPSMPKKLFTSPIEDLLESYRMDLWKNCEHLLTMNTKH